MATASIPSIPRRGEALPHSPRPGPLQSPGRTRPESGRAGGSVALRPRPGSLSRPGPREARPGWRECAAPRAPLGARSRSDRYFIAFLEGERLSLRPRAGLGREGEEGERRGGGRGWRSRDLGLSPPPASPRPPRVAAVRPGRTPGAQSSRGSALFPERGPPRRPEDAPCIWGAPAATGPCPGRRPDLSPGPGRENGRTPG